MNCIDCGKIIRRGWGNRKRCGSIKYETGCAYENYLKPTLKKQISFLDKNYKWRINNLLRVNYFCEGCGLKGRQKTVLDFPDLPILYVDRPINDIIKNNNITTVEEAELCEEFWKDGKVLCVNCYDKIHKTNLRKMEKTLLKNKLKAEKIKFLKK